MRKPFLLERLYLATELDLLPSARLKAVGRLLNAAFDGPPPDTEMDRLLGRLAAIPVTPHLPWAGPERSTARPQLPVHA